MYKIGRIIIQLADKKIYHENIQPRTIFLNRKGFLLHYDALLSNIDCLSYIFLNKNGLNSFYSPPSLN